MNQFELEILQLEIKFREKFQINDWTSIMINEGPVTAFSEFFSTLNNIDEDSFPLIESKLNKTRTPSTLGLHLLC